MNVLLINGSPKGKRSNSLRPVSYTHLKTSFNVVVVQECAPVTYDENGNPCVAPDAKWDATAQYDKEEGEE